MHIRDSADEFAIGDFGFLIEVAPQDRAPYYRISKEPLRTNMSHVAKLNGWCGSYNNVNSYARGVVEITARNGSGYVGRAVDGYEELKRALKTLGWSNLT